MRLPSCASLVLGSLLAAAAACGGSTTSGGNPPLDGGTEDGGPIVSNEAGPPRRCRCPARARVEGRPPARRRQLGVDGRQGEAPRGVARHAPPQGRRPAETCTSASSRRRSARFGGDVCPNDGRVQRARAPQHGGPATSRRERAQGLPRVRWRSIDHRRARRRRRDARQRRRPERLRARGAARERVSLPRPARSVGARQARRVRTRPSSRRRRHRLLLAQRKAFLRPDSLVVVVMLTDEDDSSPDPLAVGGQGWAFWRSSSRARRSSAPTARRRPRRAGRARARPIPGSCRLHVVRIRGHVQPGRRRVPEDQERSELQSGQKNGGYYGADRGPAQRALPPHEGALRHRPAVSRSRATSTGSRSSASRTRTASTSRGRGDAARDRRLHRHAERARTRSSPRRCRRAGRRALQPAAGPARQRARLLRGHRRRARGARDGAPELDAILGADPGRVRLHAGIDPHMIQSIAPRAGPRRRRAHARRQRQRSGPRPRVDTGGRRPAVSHAPSRCPRRAPAPRRTVAATARREKNPPLCATARRPTPRQGLSDDASAARREGLGDRGVVGSICRRRATKQ